jgi:hypothetical protein
MTAMRLFEDSWKRVDRAEMHGKAFTAEWNGLLKPEAFEFRTEQKSDKTFVLVGRFREIPKNDLALELGEFFYQLRAALDGIIFKTAEVKSAPNLPADEDRLEFPIYETSKRFKNSAVYRGPFPQELRDWLESVQSYNAANSGDPKVVEYGRRLKLLHDCARKDRHRRLHLVAAVPVSANWNFDPPLAISQVRQLNANFFEHEAEFLELHVSDEVHLKGQLSLNISVGEMPGPLGQAVVGEMEGLLEAVSLIVEDFEMAFK